MRGAILEWERTLRVALWIWIQTCDVVAVVLLQLFGSSQASSSWPENPLTFGPCQPLFSLLSRARWVSPTYYNTVLSSWESSSAGEEAASEGLLSPISGSIWSRRERSWESLRRSQKSGSAASFRQKWLLKVKMGGHARDEREMHDASQVARGSTLLDMSIRGR